MILINIYGNKKITITSILILLISIITIICIFEKKNAQKDNTLSTFITNMDSEIENKEENKQNEQIVTETKLYVHISGEVNNPGLVEIKEGDRIKDIIEKAGGITEDANLTNVNLAYKVSDGQKINIPNKNDKKESENIIIEKIDKNVIIDTQVSKQDKININTATQEELEKLEGIGPSTANKIIEQRNKNGKYKKIEDIQNVPGIGTSKFEKIKDKIEV